MEDRMLLVPRQLRRYGMTGDVPYYGGLLSPAQAYAASHPGAPRPAGVPTNEALLHSSNVVPGGTRNLVALAPPGQAAAINTARGPSGGTGLAPAAAGNRASTNAAALQQLLTSGVISRAEYDQLQARVR
jgi:hypothetical protein